MSEKAWQQESETAGHIESTCSQEGEKDKRWCLVSVLPFIQSGIVAHAMVPSIDRVAFFTSPNLI